MRIFCGGAFTVFVPEALPEAKCRFWNFALENNKISELKYPGEYSKIWKYNMFSSFDLVSLFVRENIFDCIYLQETI